MENFSIALVWIAFIAAVYFGWYFFIKARNKERMALIESGKDVSDIFSKKEIKFRFPWLKVGLLLAGIGFGMAVVSIFLFLLGLAPNGIEDETSGVLIATSGLFFGGVGITIAYFIDRKKP